VKAKQAAAGLEEFREALEAALKDVAREPREAKQPPWKSPWRD